MHAHLRAAFPVLPLLALVLPSVVLAQPANPVTIKSIRLFPTPAGPVVTIEADGPLPEPVVGEVDGPPRVFLDFAGVATSARSVAQSIDVVKRVRIALHSANPPSTRVVLDLERLQPVRVDTSAKGAGRLAIMVGEAVAPTPSKPEPPLPPTPVPPAAVSAPSTTSTPPAPKRADPPADPPSSVPKDPPLPPVPQLRSETPPPPTTSTPPAPSPAPPRAPAPNRSTSAKIPQRDAERYREQVGESLERLRALRATLMAVDQQEPLQSLKETRTEVATIVRSLNSVRPSEAVRNTHDLLVRSASLALMALTLRDVPPDAPPDQEALRNAASAAAGALLLLDRVCMEIGCTAPEASR